MQRQLGQVGLVKMKEKETLNVLTWVVADPINQNPDAIVDTYKVL